MNSQSPTRVVVATGNPGKVRELADALSGLPFELVVQGELGIEAAPETACTFLENALGKARHAAVESRLPAIADDSGLVVPSLGGAPGIHSARYAGVGASDAENNAKLLRELGSRMPCAAYFTCCLVYVASPADPAPAVATARWHGQIISSPRGSNGFGYDPHFLVPNLGKTSAQLPLAQKNRLSHRGQACRLLAGLLAENGGPPACPP